MSRSAIAIAGLLVACNPAPDAPTVPLRADDLVELERMRQLWLAEGLAGPGDCGRDAEIVYPASDAEVLRWCGQPSDACLSSMMSWRFGPFGGRTPLLVVSHTQPRGSWKHEAGHLWQKCAGLPRQHDAAFVRWLKAVEAHE